MRNFDLISHLLVFRFRFRMCDFTQGVLRRTVGNMGIVSHLLEGLLSGQA